MVFTIGDTMKRTMIEVRTFNVYLHCDCGGMMEWNNITLTVNPPLFPHFCSDCKKQETLTEVYPTETTVEVGEEQGLPPTED